MILTIELTPEQKAQLEIAAQKEGLDPAELARKLVTEHLPTLPMEKGEDPTIDLLQTWLEQDATEDPDEIHRAQEELDQFKQAINQERERSGTRRIYP